jgi:hypothetical protein
MESLKGKKFKYIDKSKNGLSKWTSTIKEVFTSGVAVHPHRYYTSPYIVSENGIPYKLTEIKILD